MYSLEQITGDESLRRKIFPICEKKVFLAHAAVTALPKPVADAVIDYTQRSCENHQEFGEVLADIKKARTVAAGLIGAGPEEIALLGPTSLGLSLFANGFPWEPGDEVLCYHDDYPANVYPWMDLERRGVVVRYLTPATPGEITPELVREALTPKTRMVALASCHFFSGYRIDVDAIGKLLKERGVFFSLDAIQTLGAFPLSVKYVDFLSADAHKWMLGPLAIGIVYVKKEHFDLLRPSLLGAWNVHSPNFITQDKIHFPPTAQRYEPGVLNAAGIYGMKAALEMISEIGQEQIANRILQLRNYCVQRLGADGFEIAGVAAGESAGGIVTFSHPQKDMAKLYAALEKQNIVVSLRISRSGMQFIRVSPHFYNTVSELDTLVEVINQA